MSVRHEVAKNFILKRLHFCTRFRVSCKGVATELTIILCKKFWTQKSFGLLTCHPTHLRCLPNGIVEFYQNVDIQKPKKNIGHTPACVGIHPWH
jgi:hypothetical protein